MNTLISNFFGYLQLYTSRIIPILIIGGVLECIFLFFAYKGYIQYKQKAYIRIITSVLLSLSIALIIVMTLYGRRPGIESEYRFQVFASYIEVFREKNAEVLLQIIMNIVMFIPVGLLLSCCFIWFEKNKRVFLCIIIFSGFIECTQGIFKMGMFEIDDILGNVFGAEVGFFLFYLAHKIYQKIVVFHE